MRRLLPLLGLSALLLLAVAPSVWARWPVAYPEVKPRTNLIGPKAPTKLVAASAGEVHTTLSGTAICVRLSCSVDVAYLTGASGSPPVATVDANQLYARTVEKFCTSASAASDYISIYVTAAGTCYVAELNDP